MARPLSPSQTAMSAPERRTLTTVFGSLWVVYLVNSLLLGGALVNFGIVPRTLTGLIGVIAAPFLHASLMHILANTLVGLPSALAVLRRGQREFLGVTVFTALTSGLSVWLFGSAMTLTVGFSGVLFGYLGYLFGLMWARGPYDPPARGPALRSLIFALLLSLLPGISFTAHLGGLLGGIALVLLRAQVMRSRIR